MAKRKKRSDLDDLLPLLTREDINYMRKLRGSGGLLGVKKAPRKYRKLLDLEILRLRPCGHLHVTVLGWRVLHRLGYETIHTKQQEVVQKYLSKRSLLDRLFNW